MYLSAKATLLEEANLQASMAAAAVATSVSESLEVRSPTPDQVTVSSAPYGPTAIKGTSVLHRLMNLSSGGDRDKSKVTSETANIFDMSKAWSSAAIEMEKSARMYPRERDGYLCCTEWSSSLMFIFLTTGLDINIHSARAAQPTGSFRRQ